MIHGKWGIVEVFFLFFCGCFNFIMNMFFILFWLSSLYISDCVLHLNEFVMKRCLLLLGWSTFGVVIVK